MTAAVSAVRRRGRVHLLGRNEHYVKSKQRVAGQGEVFIPAWIVEAMLDLVKEFHLLVWLKVFNTG